MNDKEKPKRKRKKTYELVYTTSELSKKFDEQIEKDLEEINQEYFIRGADEWCQQLYPEYKD